MAMLTLAAQAGSQYVQHQGQKSQADYTTKSNAIATTAIENEATARQTEGGRLRAAEYQQDASEVNAHQLEAMRERATLDALLGEYGIGNTGDRRLAALGIAQGQDLATVRDNATRGQAELGLAESADVASIRSRVTGLPVAQRPSGAGLALGLAGSALQLGSRLDAINDPHGDIRRQKTARASYRASPMGRFMTGNRGSGD